MKKVNKILLELCNDKKQLLFLSFLTYISYIIEGITPSDPSVIQASGGLIAVAAVGATMGAISLFKAAKTRGKADEAQEDANRLAQQNLDMQKQQMDRSFELQKEEAAKLEVQKQKYRDIEFKNPYENLESRAEDLTVNTQQAEFQAEQGQQAKLTRCRWWKWYCRFSTSVS